MFHQGCTAEPTGEVEFLDVNHCIITEDDFGSATKDFARPTMEGRQFINCKLHHTNAIFKSVLLEEAIKLRRLNQRKENWFTNLNRIQENVIGSIFSFDMANGMVAVVSNWGERMYPQM